jgi:hypothetical protein
MLIIPQQATFDVLDKKCAFVLDEHNIVRGPADQGRVPWP